MLPEQKGLLSSLFSRFRQSRATSRKAPRKVRGFGRSLQLEELEPRRLLISRVFLDFGEGFTAPTTGPYAGWGTMLGLQPGALHDALVGTGAGANVPGGNNIFEEFLGIIANGVTVNPAYNMVDFSDLLTLGSPDLAAPNPVVPTDPITMELAITHQIEQALEPFDIQVISSINSPIFNFPVAGGAAAQLGNASSLLALNNLAGDGGSPVNGTATVPQGGSDDVYVYFGGLYQTVQNAAVSSLVPMSASFAVRVPDSAGGVPDRLDSGAIIDANYWIQRVLGAGGSAGSLNVALANAALYTIGWGYGLSEVENGTLGPNTNFFDPNVALVNQANAMVEAGFSESFIAGLTLANPISDSAAAHYARFPMMQDGTDFQPLLRPGTQGNPPVLFNPGFPIPPTGFPTFVPPVTTVNEDPNVTVNTYDQLVKDSDIGANPDVAYVTGTGAFDQITIQKINPTQAQVTVKAFDSNTYTNLIASTSYTINLTKLFVPGRLDDGKPFKIVVEGCNNDDQIFLDPTLGVHVDIHGGPDVKALKIVGNSGISLQYTPNSPPAPNSAVGLVNSLIPEGLIQGGGGVLAINGTTTSTTTTKVGNKFVTKTVATPFTTTVTLDHFNSANASALRVENFGSLTYKSPGFLDNTFDIDRMLIDSAWQISGQVTSPVFGSLLTGDLQFTNVGQLVIDTSRGASNDTITFNSDNIAAPGLKSVNIIAGTGNDVLHFNDAPSLENVTYTLSPTLVLPQIGSFQPFSGFFYSGVEDLTVDGTSGSAKYVVTPSLTTAITVNGNSIAPDTSSLAVRLTGTTGRRSRRQVLRLVYLHLPADINR